MKYHYGYKVENIMAKGDFADDEQFLHLTFIFSRKSPDTVIKVKMSVQVGKH